MDDYHWIEENEMLDLVAIAQSSPGPIAVNGAIVVGISLPECLEYWWQSLEQLFHVFDYICDFGLLQCFPQQYFVSQMLEGMQAGVGAVIASVTYEMGGRYRSG